MILPSVTIVMAIYKPNIKWLEEQLQSLNEQKYENLQLLVWNDCPNDSNHEEVFSKYITKFPYKIIKGKINLGSNGAFGELTKLADTDYIAYCDQDDIWMPEKIGVLVTKALKTKADLVCSDMYVIDADSNVVADSILKVRPHQIFYTGNKLFEYLLTKNFVTGCTTLVKYDIAKKALPFPKYTVHDWWLALYTSIHGKLVTVKQPLIKYRIHGNNQTGILGGVESKTTYYEKRILFYLNKNNELYDRLQSSNVSNVIKKSLQWGKYRKAYFNNFTIKNLYNMWNYRKINKNTTYFEIAMKFLPEFLFKYLIQLIKTGKL